MNNAAVNIVYMVVFFLRFYLFERESERAQAGGRQREREKQASH